MIAITGQQTDSLKELVNIAFGLTASKLSEISNRRVLLEPPAVAIHRMPDLARELGSFVTGDVATIHQVFSGPVSGDAILLLNYDGALRLTNLLLEERLRSPRFDTSTEEVLTEVGNMLLSACLGVFGNVLKVHVTFSVPRLQLDSLGHFLTSITIGDRGLQYAVLISASFKIVDQEVEGRVVTILGVSSLARLIKAIDGWEESQNPEQ
jgi:chemotaxis protein CheC